MKTILVPTDFSTYGSRAASLATSLASKMHARILLQHNVPTLLRWSSMTPDEHKKYPQILHESIESENHLNKIISDNELRHLNVTRVITHGVTNEEIIEEARKESADLIVLGSHGNEKHDKFFIGSNVQKVLREAPCPVVTVNREPHYPSWSKLVVPVSLDEDISPAFDKIKTVAQSLDSSVHLLYVNTPTGFKEERTINGGFQAIIHRYPELRFETAIYSSSSIDTGILEYCHRIDADWIAMVTHNRKHKDKYLIGISEVIAFKSDIPLMTVVLN